MKLFAAQGAASLSIALTVGLILRIYLALGTPIGSASVPGHLCSYNDELAHGTYAYHLLQSGTLPLHVESIQSAGALDRGNFENYQPPLYYLILAGLCSTLDLSNLEQVILAGRLINCVLSLAMLALFVVLSKELALNRGAVTLGFMFVSLSGVVIRFSSTATNEVLFWVFAGLVIWTAVRIWHSGLQLSSLAVFVAASVAALYTKMSAILLLPLLLVFLLKRRDTQTTVMTVAAYLTILVLTLPIWFRNVHEFGSLIPLSAGFGVPTRATPDVRFVAYALRSFVFPWQEFWRGWLGVVTMLPFLIYLLLSSAGRAVVETLIRQPVLLSALLITGLAFLWLNFRYDQAEARYLFAAWPVLALLFSGLPDRARSAPIMLAVSLLPYILFLLPAPGS
jgi:hypothetical protein